MSYAVLFGEWLANAGSQILFNVVVAFLLVTLGIALAFLAKGLIVGLLRSVKFDELVSRLHVSDLFGKLAVSELLGDIAEVAIIIAFSVQALSYLGWELIARALESVLYWIPGVIAALFVFMIFYAIGRWVQIRMEASEGVAHRFGPVAMGLIVFFGAIIALDQVGLNTALIQQAVLIVLFGFALAFALAVGIALGFGLKDDVHDYVRAKLGTKRTVGTRKRATKSTKGSTRKR
jgi:hypothetical protein